MVGEAPFGDDRTATGDDPGDPVGGPGDEGEADAGMYGEVVDALFGLLDQRIPVDLPGQLLDDPAHRLEGLVDRDGPDRDGGVPDDPLAGLVDILAGREIHDRVGSPEGGPAELLDHLLDRAGHRRVADIGVDLDLEVAADEHRLTLGVVDIGGDDGAPTGDLAPHELRVHPLAERDELHLRGDLASAGVGYQGHGPPRAGAGDPWEERGGPLSSARSHGHKVRWQVQR